MIFVIRTQDKFIGMPHPLQMFNENLAQLNKSQNR